MVTIIGSGNVASWFAYAFHKAGFEIGQVFSRHIENAQRLASLYSAQAVDSLSDLKDGAELYLFSVKDDCLQSLVEQVPFRMNLAAHTAGSVSQQVFKGYAKSFGIVYPYQTISKALDFNELQVPLCIEGDSETSALRLKAIAEKLSRQTFLISERQRFVLHLAAVFASNFSNAMYGIAYDILQKNGMDWKIMMPLLENTLQKVHTMSPAEAQTGPARRKDNAVMNKHVEALDNDKWKAIYRLVSEEIMRRIP